MQATVNLGCLAELRVPTFFSFKEKKWNLLGCYYAPDPTLHGPRKKTLRVVVVVVCLCVFSLLRSAVVKRVLDSAPQLLTAPSSRRTGAPSCSSPPTPGKHSPTLARSLSRVSVREKIAAARTRRLTRALEAEADAAAAAACVAFAGLLVLKTDNRGSFGRSVLFEKCIHRALGRREVEDQSAACLHLQKINILRLRETEEEKAEAASSRRSFSALPEGVGIYGVSYGGFLSALAYFLRPDVFSCAFSGAPVTLWEVRRVLLLQNCCRRESPTLSDCMRASVGAREELCVSGVQHSLHGEVLGDSPAKR